MRMNNNILLLFMVHGSWFIVHRLSFIVLCPTQEPSGSLNAHLRCCQNLSLNVGIMTDADGHVEVRTRHCNNQPTSLDFSERFG